MEIIAIIPARGGSKSLPWKNIRPFLGRPLIYWSIIAALRATAVTRVIVSTDSSKIADIAVQTGAEAPFIRPQELSGDDVVDYPVIRHCLDYLYEIEGYSAELVVQLRPTSPIRPLGLIDQGIHQLLEVDRADSLRVVCTPTNNPYKMWRIEEGFLVPLFESGIPEQFNQPRQKLPVAYWQIGTLDVIRTRTIYKKKSTTGNVVLPLVVEPTLAIDIDDQASLKRAEFMCQSLGLEA